MSTIATADNLDDLIDFDCPFALTRDDDGTVTFERTDERPGNYRGPRNVYSPTVEHSAVHDVLIDGHAMDCGCGYCHWEPLTGRTGQYGYNGAVMHASEFIGGGLAADLLDTADEHPIYAVTAVEVLDCDEDCDEGHTPDDVYDGVWTHEPAGWCILRLRP